MSLVKRPASMEEYLEMIKSTLFDVEELRMSVEYDEEFMEGALDIWWELGMPSLKLQEPWYSYELGHWPKESAEDAERAVKGEYYKTSEMRAKKRVKLPKISSEDLYRYYR